MDALKYAKSEGRHIAYRIHDGAADHDLVLFTPGGTVPMDSLEDDRIGARLVSGDAVLEVVLLSMYGLFFVPHGIRLLL